MMKKLSMISFVTSFIFLGSCNSRWCGDLGNNLFLMEGDNIYDRIIVYCSSRELGCCNGGMYVIPTYEHHMQNGKYAEYVETAKSDNKWVIVKTLRILGNMQNESGERYWIMDKDFGLDNINCDRVNCDSTIQSCVKGPFDIKGFNEKKQS